MGFGRITDGGRITTTDYCGNIIYKNDSLYMILTNEGYITMNNNSPQYHYLIKDHLGSNRVVISSTGNIEQQDAYYPFGGQMAPAPQSDLQPFKYNGKEQQTLQWLYTMDYGARLYNPSLARWTTSDPMSEKYYGTSGYVYCIDIPVIFCDPTGRTIWIYYNDGEGKKQKIQYSAGMKYSGNNEFVSSSINSLNAMNSVKAGAKVLSALTSSKYDYDFTNTQSAAGSQSMSFDYKHDDKYDEGGGEIHAASLLNSSLGDERKVELSSYELFHGYQRENGSS